MGNIKSKRISKETKQQKVQMREKALQGRTTQFEDIEQQYVTETMKQMNNNSDALVVANFQQNMAILTTSKEQLKRGGAAFTKADLVAIVCYIQPEYMSNIEQIRQYTNEDLCAIIRLVIYDPTHLASATTAASTSASYPQKIAGTNLMLLDGPVTPLMAATTTMVIPIRKA